MFNEPRNWKWMVPAALMAPCLYWWNKWVMAEGEWKELAIIPACLTAIMVLAAALNFFLYAWNRWADMYATVMMARNTTPEARMFEAAKGMHPDAVKALLVHRRSIWRIRYVPMKDVVDWIFDEIPTVHAGFVDFVLDHSSGVGLMSKRLLSDGSKQFDPEELVTDYQQYDDLITYLQVKLICTQAYGNQAPQWLPPWNPDLVRHRMGLDGAPYAVEEEGLSEAMKAVMRAQAQWQKGGLKDLGATEPVVNGNGNGKKKEPVEPDLTDEELAETQRIQAEHEERLQKGN